MIEELKTTRDFVEELGLMAIAKAFGKPIEETRIEYEKIKESQRKGNN